MNDSIISLNPINPSMRFRRIVKTEISNNFLKPFKSLLKGIKSSSGRDCRGHITSRFRGGGHKKSYRIIKFQWLPSDLHSSFEVLGFEYDPNRNVPIARCVFISGTNTGSTFYILYSKGMNTGDKLSFTDSVSDIKPGLVAKLKNIPIGSFVHSVNMKEWKISQVARSAGSFVQILGKSDNGYVTVKMPSGSSRKFSDECVASIGIVGNAKFSNTSIGKAGRNRWLGKKPHVRGVAMNPVDHPLGGGEGKTSGGRHPVSPWGKNCKGLKTRKNKRTSIFLVSNSK